MDFKQQESRSVIKEKEREGEWHHLRDLLAAKNAQRVKASV
jgi:hypothetical protein